MELKRIEHKLTVCKVADISMKFYEKALGLKKIRRKTAEDGSFIIVYIGNEEAAGRAIKY